jgi:hypothetical protein
LTIEEIYCFKKFINDVVKAKDLKPNQSDFLKGILSKIKIECTDTGIDKLEIIYKYLSDFKISDEKQTNKTKTLGSKFKQKLILITK